MKKKTALLISFIVIISSFGIVTKAETVSDEATFKANTYFAKSSFNYETTLTQKAISNGTISPDSNLNTRLKLCKILYDGMLNMQNTIDITSLNLADTSENLDMVVDCVQYVVASYSHLFMVDDSFTPSTKQVIINYTMSSETYATYLEQYSTMLNDIIKEIPANISELGKILFVYDYLALNFRYDTDYKIFDVYNYLIQKKGVCQAYADTFSAIMNELNIPCTEAYFLVTEFDSEDEENHIWNIVELDGNYYHIDTTWSDPVPDVAGYVSHDYFLLSDYTINKNGNHSHYYTNEDYLYYTTIECNNQKYESGYLWIDSMTAFVSYGNEFYFITDDNNTVLSNGAYYSNASIRKTSDFITSTYVTQIKSPAWSVIDSNNSVVSCINNQFFTGISIIDSQIYYNTSKSIMYYDIKNSSTGVVDTINSTKDIFYSYYCGNGEFTCSINNFKLQGTNTAIAPYNTLEPYKINVKTSGDVNNDGFINATDIAILSQYLVNCNSANICAARCDLSGERFINVRDLIHLKKLFAELI